MKYTVLFLGLLPCVCSAGPYVEFGVDYDPDPAFRHSSVVDADTGEVFSQSRTEASNYVGSAAIGWRWDFSSVISDQDNITVKLKALEHRSDINNSGERDIVSKDRIRGVSIEYAFW